MDSSTLEQKALSRLPDSKGRVEFFLRGVSLFYPDVYFGSTEGKKQEVASKYSSPYGHYNKDQFTEILFFATNSHSVEEALEIINAWNKYFEEKGVEKLQEPAPTTPDAIWLNERLKEMEKKATDDPVLALRRAKEFEIRVQRYKEAKQKAEGLPKELYIEVNPEKIPAVSLNEQEQKSWKALVAAAQKDPATTVEQLSLEIFKNLSPEIKNQLTQEQIKVLSYIAALDATTKLIDSQGKIDVATPVRPLGEGAALTALVNPNNPNLIRLIPDKITRIEIIKFSQDRLNTIDTSNGFLRSVLSGVLGPNIPQVLYPSYLPGQFEITPNESGNSINLQEFYSSAFLEEERRPETEEQPNYESELAQRGFDELMGVVDFKKVVTQTGVAESVTAAITPLAGGAPVGFEIAAFQNSLTTAGIPIFSTGALSSFSRLSATAIAPVKNAFSNLLIKRVLFEKSLGPLTIMAFRLEKGLSSFGGIFFGIKKAEGSTGLVLFGEVSKEFDKIPGAVALLRGRPIPLPRIVSKALSGVSSLLSKVVGGLTKIFAFLGSLAAPVVAAILFVGGWIVEKLFSGIINWYKKHEEDIKLGLAALASAALARALARGLFRLGRRVTRSLAVKIGVPLLVAILVFPIFVAFILLIINSGAYLVPPQELVSPGVIVSLYIDVSKVASPGGPFENDQLTPPKGPLVIEYTIYVRAKKGTLTNLRFNDKCEVIRNQGAKIPGCPTADKEIPSSAPDATVSPAGNPYVIKYSRKFESSDFIDSLVIDTFTVTADVPEKENEIAAQSASIKIGKPPEDCPRGWPVSPPAGQTFAIVQGPDGGFTHTGAEAIDIVTNRQIGFLVTARHAGVVRAYPGGNSPYGKYVEIDSMCNGKIFSSRYAHLNSISVPTGRAVKMGDNIGLSGNTGFSTEAHIHYEFRNPSGRTGPGANNPPIMARDFIPKDIPRYCSAGCGSVP